jgi:hypothetical protein
VEAPDVGQYEGRNRQPDGRQEAEKGKKGKAIRG